MSRRRILRFVFETPVWLILAVMLADLASDGGGGQLGPDRVLMPVVMTGHVLPLIESPFPIVAIASVCAHERG